MSTESMTGGLAAFDGTLGTREEVHAMTTPNMSGFQVTPDDLQQASVYVSNSAQNIMAQIQQLGTYAQGLSDFWQGSAQQAFETLMADYNTYATMLDNALTDISSGLNGNYVNYSQAEQTNLNNIVSVQLPAPNFTS
jgi:WXG100 family type VII secretion target